jgi:hypothetical protein
MWLFNSYVDSLYFTWFNIFIYDIFFSLLQGNLQCIIEHTKGCKTKQYYLLYTICVEIQTLFEIGGCVSQFGDPQCGTVGILGINYLLANPYKQSSYHSVCRYINFTCSCFF